MVKINLVYATYAGINSHNIKRKYANTNRTFQISLQNYITLNHNLSQITIMKPEVPKNQKKFDKYYDLDDILKQIKCPVKQHSVDNYGYSSGQLLACYELYGDDFDYYILTEDDYTMNIDHFDDILVEIYQKKFPKDIGLLCSLVQGKPKQPNSQFPEHWEGILMVSSKTLKNVYNNKRWKGNPRKLIETMDGDVDEYLKGRKKNGGDYQITSALLFSKSGIKLEDYLDEYTFIYWCDLNNGFLIFNDKLPLDKTPEDFIKQNKFKNLKAINESIFVPTQLSRKCLLILSMHRSGSSLASNCLFTSGIDYGMSKTDIMDRYNVNGYFENENILDFNEIVLREIGSSWFDVYNRVDKKKMLKYRDKLCDILNQEFKYLNRFFIKDPRIILLWPLYKAALKHMNIMPYFIRINRNYDEVVKSLNRVHNMGYATGYKLCEIYSNGMDKVLKKPEHIEVNMMDIINEPLKFINNVETYINKELVRDEVESIPNITLKHF